MNFSRRVHPRCTWWTENLVSGLVEIRRISHVAEGFYYITDKPRKSTKAHARYTGSFGLQRMFIRVYNVRRAEYRCMSGDYILSCAKSPHLCITRKTNTGDSRLVLSSSRIAQRRTGPFSTHFADQVIVAFKPAVTRSCSVRKLRKESVGCFHLFFSAIVLISRNL